ncbi:MotA/TolQ/ExbB proton channel family protein [Hydrocarboniphaga effusa]|jgi:hypothetical protein|uniref:MotA/TolQ/ExbB proton channel family protein n=1 Tax=Hydrocarboniphaga effusa TaxID=243629 RepID=UPI0031382996
MNDDVPASLRESPQQTFLLWLCLSLLAAFIVHVCWTLDVLQHVIASDQSRITVILLLLYVACIAHGGWRAWQLSAQHASLAALRAGDAEAARDSWAGLHLRALSLPGADQASLNEVLVEQARGTHEFGWFMAGAILKLALLATVVGFMIMLSAINSLSVREFADLPQMLAQMGSGMGVSLYTTLVGLLVNMALSLQYLLLDRSADRFIAQALLFAPAPRA